jgi:hypothetical protein
LQRSAADGLFTRPSIIYSQLKEVRGMEFFESPAKERSKSGFLFLDCLNQGDPGWIRWDEVSMPG